MVTAELKADEMFSPIILEKQETENNTAMNAVFMFWISRIAFPIRTNDVVCMAEMRNSRATFARR